MEFGHSSGVTHERGSDARHDVPSKKTLNRENLEALGAQRLAELLIELGTGNAAVKRRLRLELASTQNSGEVAKEIRKRLTAIGRSRTFIDWQNRRPFVEDLESQRRAIVNQIAGTDPSESLELMWQFMALANSGRKPYKSKDSGPCLICKHARFFDSINRTA